MDVLQNIPSLIDKGPRSLATGTVTAEYDIILDVIEKGPRSLAATRAVTTEHDIVLDAIDKGPQSLATGTVTTEHDIAPDVIEKAFRSGQVQWMDEPVINEWKNKHLPILKDINVLYHKWRASGPGRFYPFSDPLWVQAADVLREIGLPWHNNNLNSPEEIDPTWPFQFKEYEKLAVRAKGARVGDEQAFGYIASWAEANQYAIRSLQHELRHQAPASRPLLVGRNIEVEIIQSAAQMFGLEFLIIGEDWEAGVAETQRLTKGLRPVIFAATAANREGRADNFSKVQEFLKLCPGLLHIDASRTFDYITSLDSAAQERLGIPKLILRHGHLNDPSDHVDRLYASTIVAAGMNCSMLPPCLVLRPRTLGIEPSPVVEYVRGVDETLSGSRDSLGPLIICLQDIRFGLDGCRQIYRQCSEKRQALYSALVEHEVATEMPVESLDLIVSPGRSLSCLEQKRMGLVELHDHRANSYLLTVQPSVTTDDMKYLVNAVSGKENAKTNFTPTQPEQEYPIPDHVIKNIRTIVTNWKTMARSSSGFPMNQAAYSALGPALGHFLPISIPSEWSSQYLDRIMDAQKRSFGVRENELGDFVGGFTTGGTMGNRVALHTGLRLYPDAYVYYSSASHYSIQKIVRDNDILTGRCFPDQGPRFAEIPADELGRMSAQALADQVLLDKNRCKSQGIHHRIILAANVGTVFAGGRDDILALRLKLRSIGSDTSYIIADGALDLGFSSDLVQLASPEVLTGKNRAPAVQSVTLSNHKVFGVMVSGQVICHSPLNNSLATVAESADPRAVLETWVISQMYPPKDLIRIRDYCLQNSQLLRCLLQKAGVRVRYSEASTITMLERVPPWIMHEFHLAPEGDWVHFIAMPHVSPQAVRYFVETVAYVDALFLSLFDYIRPQVVAILGEGVTLTRVKCQDMEKFPTIVQLVDESAGKTGYSPSWMTFKRQYIYGSMCFAAIHNHHDLLVMFPASASAWKLVRPGPVLIDPGLQCNLLALEEVASHASEFLSQRLKQDSR
ncbi:hypothetical protein V494_05331 [Pseudogymnoascus sp. VKM F-4513 (FW-928)]|nr:hypothetical protein V494_05331 [Pseudogymnoascus sp. VKM F-4513 (FW-928)]